MADASGIAREYFNTWVERDFGQLRQMLHAQYSHTGSDGQVRKGPDAGVALAEMWASAFPDAKIDIQRIHAVGDNVAIVEFVARGTHRGEPLGIAPTGRQFTSPVCTVIELRNRLIWAEREYMDMQHLMQQLGVAAIPAAAQPLAR